MTEVEKVIEKCRETGTTLAALERSCNFANGYIGRLKKGFFPPDRLQKIADYFGVTVAYFREQGETPFDYSLSVDEKDLILEMPHGQ